MCWTVNMDLRGLAAFAETSERQRGAGQLLGSHAEIHVSGANPLQTALDDLLSQLWAVALPAQVPEVKMLQIGTHHLLDSIRSRLVRQVPVPAENPLLERPGTMRTFLEHPDVVICFEHQHVRRPDSLNHQLRGVAEVRQKSEIPGRSPHHEPHRVLGVVRHAKRLNEHITNLKTGAGFKLAARNRALKLKLNRVARKAVAVDGYAELLTQPSESLHMIRVLMGYENPMQILNLATDGLETLFDLPRTEAGIDQQTRLARLEERAIAAGSASQNCQTNRHAGR